MCNLSDLCAIFGFVVGAKDVPNGKEPKRQAMTAGSKRAFFVEGRTREECPPFEYKNLPSKNSRVSPENSPNEPTDARANVPNEPTTQNENVPNEPAAGLVESGSVSEVARNVAKSCHFVPLFRVSQRHAQASQPRVGL
jgi:hypothetical protein